MNLAATFFTIKQFILYRLRAHTAHGLHSPFVYQLYTQVIGKKHGTREKRLLQRRKQLLTSSETLRYQDPKTHIYKESSVRKLAKTSASRHRFSCFLMHLIDFMGYKSVLETGTSIGITTGYLARSSAKRVVSIEGSKTLADFARRQLAQWPSNSVKIITGEVRAVFEQTLQEVQPELVFLDADHRKESIDFYLNVISKVAAVKCIIIHDIYWSEGMKKAWETSVSNPEYLLTVDLFQAGLIFPKYPMEKQHFTLKF